MVYTADNRKFYNGKRWLHLRDVILRRDGYADQIDKRYGKSTEANTVHHIFPREEFPEYQYEAWNLISLSHRNHVAMHVPSSGELSPAGVELLRRTARRYDKPLPLRYQ